MNKFLAKVGVAILALSTAASGATMTAGVATDFDNGWATWIEYDPYAARGTKNDRDNPLNALGSNLDTFFEIGLGSTVTLQFGKQFAANGTGTLFEVTFGNVSGWPESIDIFVGSISTGTFEFVRSMTNAEAAGGGSFSFSGGPFDALQLVDTSNAIGNDTTGGWDIAAARVSVVPLPAGGLLLLTGLGALALYRRRKQAEA